MGEYFENGGKFCRGVFFVSNIKTHYDSMRTKEAIGPKLYRYNLSAEMVERNSGRRRQTVG